MKNAIVKAIKKETVLCIACILALVSMFFVHPDKQYIDYIDVRTLIILFCLMAVVAGLKELGNNAENIAGAFDANAFKVAELLTAGAGTRSNEEKKENDNEID